MKEQVLIKVMGMENKFWDYLENKRKPKARKKHLSVRQYNRDHEKRQKKSKMKLVQKYSLKIWNCP